MFVKHENGKTYVKTELSEHDVELEVCRLDGIIPLSEDGEWVEVPRGLVPIQVTPEMRELAIKAKTRAEQ